MSIEQTLSRGGLREDMAMAGCDWPDCTAGLNYYKQLPLRSARLVNPSNPTLG